MACPVHKSDRSTPAVRRPLLSKRTDAEQSVIQTTLEAFRGVLRQWHSSLLDALRARDIDLSTRGAVQLGIEQALDPYRDRFDVVLADGWVDGAEAGRADAIRANELVIDFDITRSEVERALRQHGREASRQVKRRMTGDLVDALTDAHREGLGIPQIADTLQNEVFEDMQGYEARRVARTETISSSNRGNLSAYRDADVPGKQWLATDDSRTRMSHRAADGQTVPTGAQFEVGGHRAEFPGDPTLPLSERINCRCSVSPAFDI